MEKPSGKFTLAFQPYGVRLRVDAGKSILEAARIAGIGIRSICGGKGICGKCTVIVQKGQVDLKPDGKASAPGDESKQYVLACIAYPLGDCEIFVPPRSRIEGQRLQLEAKIPVTELDPSIVKFYIPPSEVADLARSMRNRGISIDQGISDALAMPHPAGLTVVIKRDRIGIKAIASEEGDTGERCFGLAADIGTTKIVAYLVDLTTGKILGMASEFNKQMIYGEDLVSRIGYAMERVEGAKEVQMAAIETLNSLISSLMSKVGCKAGDIVDVCVAGNTVMTYLLAGIDASPLLNAGATVQRNPMVLKQAELGLRVSPYAEVYCLPCSSRFLGGDVIGDIIASGLHDSIDPALLIDIGTNAEVVIGCRDWFISTTAAAGPAFEGWGVKFGIRAVDGAIDGLTIDPITMKADYSVVGGTKPKGICGSGFMDLLAEMFRRGIVDSSGKVDCNIKTKFIRESENGCEYIVAEAGDTEVGEDITISDKDISNLLDGKAAVCASVSIIMKKMRLTVSDIKRVIVCGAFGSNLNLSSAMAIGLIPEFEEADIAYIGNGSVAGAYLSLISRGHRGHAESVAKLVSYIDLMKDVDFMDEYTAAFSFPGKEELFPSRWWKKRQ